MLLTIVCDKCQTELMADVAYNSVRVYPHTCEATPKPEPKPEPEPIRRMWGQLVKRFAGKTVELRYYRKDGYYREFDCQLYDSQHEGRVLIMDVTAQTPKTLIKKNIASIYDYVEDQEYQVIGGLYVS